MSASLAEQTWLELGLCCLPVWLVDRKPALFLSVTLSLTLTLTLTLQVGRGDDDWPSMDEMLAMGKRVLLLNGVQYGAHMQPLIFKK